MRNSLPAIQFVRQTEIAGADPGRFRDPDGGRAAA
jgi:hypothetical protein